MNETTHRDYVGPGEQVQSKRKNKNTKESEFTTKLSPGGEPAALFFLVHSEGEKKKKKEKNRPELQFSARSHSLQGDLAFVEVGLIC